MHHLIDINGVAELFGITRQGAYKLVQLERGFPAPVAELTAGRVWETNAVERWARLDGPRAREEYMAWVFDRIPRGADADALQHYRMALRIGMSKALGRNPEGVTLADAHSEAVEAGRTVEESFNWPPPPSQAAWARETGRLSGQGIMPPWEQFESNGREMAQVYLQRVTASVALSEGAPVQFTSVDGRVLIGTVVDFDEAQARVIIKQVNL